MSSQSDSANFDRFTWFRFYDQGAYSPDSEPIPPDSEPIPADSISDSESSTTNNSRYKYPASSTSLLFFSSPRLDVQHKSGISHKSLMIEIEDVSSNQK